MSEEWRTTPSELPCINPRIAFRDISRATDTRTTRIALIPPRVAITNKGPYLLRIRGDAIDEAFLLGMMSSVPFDWFSRRYVEVNLNFFILNPLPIPRPELDDPLRLRVIGIAGRLASQDARFANWASQVGVECGELSDDEKRSMMMELDAVVAHLYGLSERQLESIYRTFHHDGTVDGEPWEQRYDAVIEHYRRWTD
jgi:hypothetical protein